MADLIERQAVIDVVHKSIFGFFEICDDNSEEPINERDKLLLEVNKAICNSIKDVPSAQPEPQWIPCSERLPSEGENVLLCDTRFGNVAIGKLIRYNTSCCWEVDHWDCDIEDWQAWMPLPEPWRGEEHD